MEFEKVRRNIYIDKELVEKANEDAQRLGISFSAYVSVAISEYIKQNSISDLASFVKQLQQGQVKGE